MPCLEKKKWLCGDHKYVTFGKPPNGCKNLWKRMQRRNWQLIFIFSKGWRLQYARDVHTMALWQLKCEEREIVKLKCSVAFSLLVCCFLCFNFCSVFIYSKSIHKLLFEPSSVQRSSMQGHAHLQSCVQQLVLMTRFWSAAGRIRNFGHLCKKQ